MKQMVRNYFGKVVMLVLAMAMAVSVTWMFDGEGSVAYAANSADYFTETQDGLTITENMTAPMPETEGKESYIFAGYYAEETCETPVKASTDAVVYKKFVPAEIMNVKAQVTKGTNGDTAKTDMRLVTTVDGLNYKEVGFDIYFDGATNPINVKTTKVYKKIFAAKDGNEFGYSPNAFDLDSEYFTTVNLLNIAKKNYDKTFFVKPYWKTLDGTKVYGISRMARVSDSYNDIANIPVRIYSVNVGASNQITITYDSADFVYQGMDAGSVDAGVTVNEENGTITCATSKALTNVNDMLVNLRFKVKDTASSNENFAMAGTGACSYVYKLFDTEYHGTPDIEWYDDSQNTFVLASPAELYGFASLVNGGEKFKDQTVYLAADITINDMTVAEMQTALSDTGIDDPVVWTAIGYNASGTKDANVSSYFGGIFDGQEHKIQGLYVKEYGMFGWAYGATIRNFSLKDSYIDSSVQSGSVVSTFDGTMDSVYSDATIVDTSGTTGGLIGRITNGTKTGAVASSQFTVSNCWYAGKISQTYSGGTSTCGGLVGFVVQGTGQDSHVIEHSLFTGEMTCHNTYGSTHSSRFLRAGGLVGALNSATMPLTISDSLSAGTLVEATSSKLLKKVGSVVGYNGATTVSNDESVYATEAWEGFTVNQELHEDVTIPSETIDTYLSYTNMPNLDYYKSTNPDGYWVVRENAVPALKSFADEWIDVAWYYDDESDVYTLDTAEQLYGFAALSQSSTFSGKTIQLGNDIKVNKKTIDSDSLASGLREWKSIGSSSSLFAGTFDGQGHTISGLYQHATKDYSGLFAATDEGSTVRDLKLTNSYFVSDAGYMGSIAGQGAGTFDAIYSNAVVEGAGTQIGGLIGRVNKVGTSQHVINNCWFDGEVVLTYATNEKVYGGAIVGAFVQGTLDITNCLNTGSVTHISATDLTSNTNYYVGGMCGAVMNASVLRISNCFNAGELTAVLENGTKDAQKVISAAVGYVANGNSSKKTTINRFFYIGECCNSLIKQPSGKSYITFNGSNVFEKMDDISGKSSYINAVDNKNNKLDFYSSSNPDGAWVVTEDNIPALKSFTDEWIDVAWYYDTEDYDGGNHTFEVSTPEEFYGFSAISQEYSFENDTVNLCANVNLGKVADREWTPIGSSVENAFQGTFNGNGKTIKGIHVTLNDSSNYIGLFGWVADATIKNFTLSNSTFTGNAMAMGAIVGNGDGTLVNIYCDNSVVLETTSTTTVGGMFGRVQDPLQTTNSDRIANTLLTVSNCWFDGKIKQTIGANSTTTSGGIVGYLIHGTANVENCLFTGNIDCAKTASGNKHLYIGGIFGKANGTSSTNYSIKNSLGAGSELKATVNGCNKYVGAVAGQAQGNETFSNVYATTECASLAIGQLSGGSTQPTTPVAKTELYNTIENLDANYWVAQETGTPVLKSFSDSYEIPEGTEWLYESVGNEADPFIISNAKDLEGFGTLVNAGTTFKNEFVQLGNDIVVNEGNAKDWAEGKNTPSKSWTPIGTVDGDTIVNVFQGTFDGAGHAIRGLYVTDEAGTYLGLFRKIKDATICDLRIENSYFGTDKATYVGSVAGGGDGTFDSVYSNAIVHGSRFVGGLIGRVSENKTNGDTKMTLTNCHFDGVADLDYTGTKQLYSGGLVGYVVHGSTIIDTCLYTGKITLDYNCNTTNKTSWDAYVGALCGGDQGTDNGYVQVKNCISAGSVEATVLSESKSPNVVVAKMNQTVGYTRHANSWAKNTYVISNNTRTNESTDVTTQSNELYARGNNSLDANFDVDGSFDKEILFGLAAQLWTNLSFKDADRIAADNAALEEGAAAITEAGPIWAAIAGDLPVPATLAENALPITIGKVSETLSGSGTQADPFKVTSVEDLAGFALLSKDDNFAGEYVVLTKDIIINQGEDASKWVDDKAEPTLPWAVAIGSAAGTNGKYFEGIFDGQGHTISGICLENGAKNAREFVGLFASTEVGSEVKNLRLRNSYFEQVGTGWVGSVIGKCRGTVSNVYSDAIVKSNATYVGGIIAMADGYNYRNASAGTESRISRTVDNCWYDGRIILVDEGRYSGGILGVVNQGEWTLNNCVFTGKISCEYTGTSYAYVGGMAGATIVQKSITTSEKETKLTLNSCISAGTIKTENGDFGAGALVGRTQANVWFTDDTKATLKETKATHVVMNNVFATRDSGYQEVGYYGTYKDTDSAGTQHTAIPTITGSAVWTNNADRLVGYCTEETKGDYKGGSLDFNTFVVRKEGVPVPKNFTDLEFVTQISNVDTILALATMDDSWTTKNAVNNGLGHYVLRTTGKTYENYTAYLAALEAQGFTPYTTLEETGTDGVYNVIYTKAAGEWVLNVLFVQNTGKVTLTISNGVDSLSPDLEPENSTTSGTVALSMLQLEGSKTEFTSIQHVLGYEDYYYGNSFVFKLPNGHFVINDGGNKADMAGLMKYLRKEAGLADDDTTSKIYIDAWTVTHQHADHLAVMRSIVDNPQYAEQLVVSAIYINEPNRKAMLCEDGTDLMGTIAVQYRGIRMLKDKNGNMPKVYWCQTGQTYYFDGLTMNIIQSQEQIPVASYGKRNAGSANGTDFNTASTNMLFTTANGKKILITGDSNYVNMEWMMEAYGDSSEMFAGINVYQVVHHGKNTSYNISSVDNTFTDYVAGDGKIDVSLFPCSVYYDYSGKHERSSGVFPAAEKTNKYLIETVSTSEYHYGNGTIKVTLGNEITAGIDNSVDTGTDTPEIEAGEGE